MRYLDVFACLNRARVRYLVVGGVAVGFHGHERSTKDLDLLVDLEPVNTARALRALVRMGLRPLVPVDPEAFADPQTRKRWILQKHMVVFPWYDQRDPMFRLDLFARDPIGFPGAWVRRKVVHAGRLRVPVAGLADLVRLKRAAGRPQDLEDIRNLGRIGRR